jgi:acyl carrier protein
MTINTKIEDGGEQSARQLIRELIAELAPTTLAAPVSEGHRLVDDLGYHSLALMELAFNLEDQFGLDPIDQGAVLKIVSAGDVESYVISEIARKRASAPQPAE